MAWAILDDNFPLHPKVMAAVEQHPLARDLHVCAICYCRKFHTSGFIPRTALKTIGFVGNARSASEALLAAGLWDRVEGGFQIHDYAVLYPNDEADKLQKEETSRKRREAGRKGGIAKHARWLANDGVLPEHSASPALAHERRSGIGMGSPEKNETRADVAFRAFWELYPSHRRKAGAFVEQLFCQQMTLAGGVEPLMTALRNHVASAQWRAGKVEKMDRWLSEQLWKNTLPATDPTKADARVPEWAR